MKTHILSIVLVFQACIRMGPGHTPATEDGSYIDSLGLRASLARIDNVEDQRAGTLITQALKVPDKNTGNNAQPDFFQSIEDDYQKYLKLFRLNKNGKVLEATCKYDLLETFRVKIFDPQPFMNAILHTMKLSEITTLDYTITSDRSDTLLVEVSWARPTEQPVGKGFGITEGSLPLCITKHSVSLAASSLKASGK
jgi:hypothetical protein